MEESQWHVFQENRPGIHRIRMCRPVEMCRIFIQILIQVALTYWMDCSEASGHP